jgi:hypothetical protein
MELPYTPMLRHVNETGPLSLELNGTGVEDVDLTQAVSVEIKVIKQTDETWPINKADIHPRSVVYNLQKGDLDKEGRYFLRVYAQMSDGSSICWPGGPNSITLEVKP